MCSLAKPGCGQTLPKYFLIEGLQIEAIDGDQNVLVDAAKLNDLPKFRKTIRDAAKAIQSVKGETPTCDDKGYDRPSKNPK
jgi:hypothetical protein